MKRKFYIYIILIFFFTCCKKEHKKEAVISKYESIDSIRIDVDNGVELLFPRTINVISDYIIVTNHDERFFFHIYDRNDLEYLGHFGGKGRGPGEYLSPTIISNSKKRDKVFLTIFDQMLRKIDYVDLKRAIGSNTFRPESELLPNMLGLAESIIYKSKDTIIYAPDNGLTDARFCIYTYNTKQKKEVPFIPELSNKPSPLNYYPIYNTISNLVNEKKEIIALTPSMMGQIDFFTKEGKYLFSHIYEHQEQLNFASKKENIFRFNPIVYYTELKGYENKIYMLCTKIVKDHHFSLSEIYLFDWYKDGIKRKFLIDKVCISFDIAMETGEIYFLVYQNERFYLTKEYVL